MAQESRLFITPEKGQTIFLDSFILTDLPLATISTTAEGLYPAKGYHIGCGRSISLTRTDCEAVQKAQKEYFDFEAKAKKGAFAFGYSACELLGCGINFLQCLRANCLDGCIDSSTPPNPSEPMTKKPPTDQEPPTDTPD